MSGIKKETAGNTTQILLFTQPYAAISVVVSAALGVTVGSKKIVKAGTPLGGNLDARTTPFTGGTSENTQGVLVHDVDVTDGDANGALLLSGFVNTNRLETDAQALITTEVKTALNGKVWFVAEA